MEAYGEVKLFYLVKSVAINFFLLASSVIGDVNKPYHSGSDKHETSK